MDAATRRLDWEEAETVAVVAGGSDSSATAALPFHYAADDPTAAVPAGRFHSPTARSSDGPLRRKVILLPEEMLSSSKEMFSSAEKILSEKNSSDRVLSEELLPQKSLPQRADAPLSMPTTPCAAAVGGGGTATTPGTNDSNNNNNNNNNNSGSRRLIPAAVVRLPHPRHGGGRLFLCPHRQAAAVAALAAQKHRDGALRSSLASHLAELQTQGPPGHYGQTWFLTHSSLSSSSSASSSSSPRLVDMDDNPPPLVVEEVLPCNEVLLSTPVHLSFMALHALVTASGLTCKTADRFLAAEALYSAENYTDGRDQKTPPRAFSDAIGPETIDDGDCGVSDLFDEVEQPARQSARWETGGDDNGDGVGGGSIASASTVSAVRRASDWGWTDWPAAVQSHPALLLPCWHALTARDCLEPLCDVKEAGGIPYYRFSPAKAVAWLANRVRMVQQSAALRRVLQLDSATSGEESVRAAPMQMAFSVVSEYIPEALTAAVSAACGLENETAITPTPTAATAAAPPVTAGATTASPTTSTSTTTTTTTSVASGSAGGASAKRLKRAERPKGTPTLFAMFAKKAPAPP